MRRIDIANARRLRSVRRGVLIAAVAVVAIATIVAAVVRGIAASSRTHAAPVATAPRATVVEQTSTVQAGTVEVPDLIGMHSQDASVVLSAAGLVMDGAAQASTATPPADGLISAQEPISGSLVPGGSHVTVSIRAPQPVPPSVPATKSARVARKSAAKSAPRWVVCIDPGHQAHGDASPEPIGPGAKVTKARVSGGATGVKTQIPEYEIALQISMNLKRQLEARGVKVVMTRTTSDVNLSNSERAAIANNAGADLFVRIHGDGSPESATSGISTLYPADNRWTHRFFAQSRAAAGVVQSNAVAATGAVDRGIKARADLAGFNYSRVPCVLVECGFLSNPVEDRLLASPHYQDKLARGIADGVVAFLRESR